MRTKITLVLLFLNVVLFFYIARFEMIARPDANGKRVLGPEAASMDSFTRTNAAGVSVRVEKRGDGWWLTQPYDWPANRNAVAGIVNELQFLEHETSFAVKDLAKSGQSLADYGLESPALTLSFTSANQTYRLKIGDSTKIGNRLYVLSPNGEKIHVVGRSLTDSLGRPLEDLRSESIFTVPVFEVRSLSLQTAAPANLKVRLRRDGERWAFEAPILARANKAGVEGSINALNALQTKTFLAANDPRLGQAALDAPVLRVTLEGNARRETLLLGASAGAGEFYAKIENKASVFTVAMAPRLLADLTSAQETLRDARVLDFAPPTVTGLTLAAPGRPELSLQRLEAGQGAESWQLIVRNGSGQAPQTLPADTALVQELLTKLHLLAAAKFLSDAPSAADLENYGFNRPEREFTLNLNAGGGPGGNAPSILSLQIGVAPDQRDAAYARVTNAPYVYQIDPAILTDAPALALHYRQRTLRDLPVGARIGGLKITDLATNEIILEKNAATDSSLTAESLAGESDPDNKWKALKALLTELRTLRVRRFLADNFSGDPAEFNGEQHPWKYRIDVALALEGGSGAAQTTTSTLLVTERLGGVTQLSGTAEFGGVVFEVSQELLDALFALTYAGKNDPGPLPPKPSKPTPETPQA